MSQFDNARISVRQFTILIVLGIIGDSILIIPTIIAHSAKQDAWLSMLLATICGIAAGALFAAIANRLQRQTLFNKIRQQLGKWVGGFVCLLFLFEFFMCGLTLITEMTQFMTAQLMPETPVNAIILVFLFVVIIAYRYGIEAFARMGELLFPVFLLLFLFMVVFLLPQIKETNLLPLVSEGFVGIRHGTVVAFSTGFAEMFILLMLVNHVTGNAKLTKPIITGFAIGGLILFIIVLFCVLVLGPNIMETKYYPTFVLAQKINIGNFLERVEAIIAFLWFITVFYKTLLLYFAFTSGIAQLFQLKESNMLTIPIGMLLLVGAVAGTPNTSVYISILKSSYIWFDITFCLLLPLLIFIIFVIKDKRSKLTPNDAEVQT
jgi:spore germination protein KB